MPRIDPQQLLSCLQVLLTPSGGILSKNEVQRLANLMTKFSKKLVSKCIYVLILKNTDRDLLGAFMGGGGWNLVHLWLQDAHFNKNWALVTEILELLLLTPVDVDRLKQNNMPKLVKGLTKRDDLPSIQQLASTLVEDWLVIVKDVTKAEQGVVVKGDQQLLQQVAGPVPEPDDDAMEMDETINSDKNTIVSENGVDTTFRFKFVRDGKKVISKVVAIRTNDNNNSTAAGTADSTDKGADKENSDKKDSNKIVPKTSSSSSSTNKSSSSNSSSSSKDRSKDSKSKSSHSSSSSKSSSSSSRDRDRDKKDRHKSSSSSSSSRHKSSSSSSKSSSSSSSKDKKESKEKQAEKDKDTLAKIKPQTLEKVGRIPKKTEDKTKKEERPEKKKPSFSVEVRKSSEEKPKTVKVYNSKMRSTGLLEEAKPPPPRSSTKKTTTPLLPSVIPSAKRSSPLRDSIPPPEKKSRLMESDKTAAATTKTSTPTKPKPSILQESDIFMDALAASATSNKKDLKKRKRRPSASKETSPPASPSTKPSSPTVLKNITPANFYQDTLMTSESEETEGSAKEKDTDGDVKDPGDTPMEPDEDSENASDEPKPLKGVLSYGKRKGPKRSIRWRPDSELVEIQYFELDETERVNVMKPFNDMARMEMNSEREALRSRKLPNEDIMDPQMPWRTPLELDLPDPPAEFGCKSSEKGIQFAREKHVLQAIYFNNRIPDSPAEPDHEVHQMANPITIPLDDPDNPEVDAPAQVWPEPKGSPPPPGPAIPTSVFPGLGAPGFIPPNQFPPNGMVPFTPPFGPPNMLNRPPGDWNGLPNGLPPNMPPPEIQGAFDHFVPPENGFVPPFNGPANHMPPFMNPNFNMRGRPPFRRGGPANGPWLRMGMPNQPNPGWNIRGANMANRGGGRGFCNSFKKTGFCRNRDNCPYIH